MGRKSDLIELDFQDVNQIFEKVFEALKNANDFRMLLTQTNNIFTSTHHACLL